MGPCPVETSVASKAVSPGNDSRTRWLPAAVARLLGAGLVPRLVVILLGVPCLYLITLRGGFFFLALVDMIILLGLREFYLLMKAKGYEPFEALGYFCALAISGYAWRQGVAVPLILTGSLLVIMARELWRRQPHRSLGHIAVTVFGIMYVGWLGSHLVMLRQLPASMGISSHVGAQLVFFTALVVWFTDTGAYLTGVAVGRHKLAPLISPNKTIEGAIGGLVAGTAAGILASHWFAGFLTPFAGGLLGLVGAGVGQIGDLAESMIKRDVGLKDTAELIPGHGGILDRFDSLLFVAPVFYYFFRFFII